MTCHAASKKKTIIQHEKIEIDQRFLPRSKRFALLPLQERLSYIGPEEFVQAFVQKDPLDNDKVTSAFLCMNKVPDKGSISSGYAVFLADILPPDMICLHAVWVRSETA